jgi:hypothetical protein
MNPTLTKTHEAGGAIGAYRIVKHGAADYEVLQAAASTDLLIGVASSYGAAADGDRLDIHRAGIVEVEYGGNVTRGQPLTANSDGKAIAATAKSLVHFLATGGAAGDITVTGITTADRLVAVLNEDATSGKVTDLTSEFTITAADTINNTGGTATTSNKLNVLFQRAVNIIGRAEVSGVASDIGLVCINPAQI